MGDKVLNVRIRHKYDTEANWQSKNPVLLSGEIAVSSDKNGRHKVGNGTSKWSELSYAKADLTKSDVTTALGYTPPTSNTWRGIQNNLTSDATDQSLSAAQGKVLKGLIDGINVGGRNLARNTATPKTWSSKSTYAKDTWIGSDGGSGWLPSIPVESNTEYTISFDYKLENAPDTIGIGIGTSTDGKNYTADTYGGQLSYKTYGGSITSGHFVYHLSKRTFTDKRYFAFRPLRRTENTTLTTAINLTISNFKLEKGNMATDWCPAPEDKSDTGHTHDLSTMINTLSTGTSAPLDNDYFISQYAGGGTTTTTYHRRPISALWTYIKSKGDTVYQAKGSYAAASHTHDDRYYTESEINTKLSGKADTSHAHTSFNGEIKFFNGTYTDPANGVSCSVKASGNLAATTIYESGSKLADKYVSISNHTSGEGFGFGYKKTETITIPKTTAVTTYYIKIAEQANFRFQNFYIKTIGSNTQYSFKAEISAQSYMDPHILLNTQLYNQPEIKSINFYKSGSNNAFHDIYLVIDSSTTVAKTVYIYSDGDFLKTTSTTTPTGTLKMSVPIVQSSYIYSSKNLRCSVEGNASTATKLVTPRSINGTNFDGSGNITTSTWGTARTITIGSTGKSVNGSGNVSWSLSEIGAAATSHTHSYLPLSGGTVTGATNFTNTTASTSKSTGAVKVSGGMGVAGRMSANEVMVGDGCTLKYDTTNKCLNFVFS